MKKKYAYSTAFRYLQLSALSALLLMSGQHLLAQQTSNNQVTLGAHGNNSGAPLWSAATGITPAGLMTDEEIEKARAANATPKTVGQGKSRNNFTSFSQTRKYTGNELLAYNKGYEQHPELGVLFADAPCDDCYELMDKRTATQKYFVKEGTEGRSFALQSNQYPLHYKDANGRWMTITGHLEQDKSNAGVFITKGRPVNVKINTEAGYSALTGTVGSFTYNHDIELVHVKPDGTETKLGKANWKNYTAGDDGMHVTDAWPGIDLEMTVLVNALKTNFIVKSALPAYAAGKLVLRDHIVMGDGLSLSLKQGQEYAGAIQVVNSNGAQVFVINDALAYEKNGTEQSLRKLNYRANSANELDIEIPGDMLNQAASSYPLIIDPLVTATLSSGFTYTAGTFPPAFTSTAEYCTNTNNVTVPAAATLTDIQVTYYYYGPPATSWAQSRMAFQINGACTYGWLSCAATASSSGIPGNMCGLINSTFWAAAANWGTTSGCAPAFSCTSYTLPFQILLTQQNTSTAACAQTVYATANGFTVTLFGTTAMLPAITPSTPTVMCMPSTLSLTGSPTTGTWSSSVPAVGTVSTTGVVTGLTNGTTNITYTASGCTSFINVTVGTTPTVSGTPSICFPGSTTLTGTPGGGTWTSSAPGVATVTAGVVTGVSVGTTIVNYNTGTCSRNQPVDVNSPTAVTPTTQPTGIAFSAVTASGATINFTPNGSTGYLVIASTSATLSASPASFTTYATGSSFGGGIVVQGSASGSAPAYTTTLLNSNTHYNIFVFAFNNNCVGPQYNVTAPLTGSFNTCIAAPGAPTVITSGVNFIGLSWAASPAGGGHISPINYTVYAYLDAALTTPAPGYPLAAGSTTTFTATGLATGTQYWFRISAADACSITSGVSTGMTTCVAAGSIPYLQTFEVATTLSDRNPNCMTSNVQNCVFSGVQTTATYIGTISTNHTPGGTKFYNFFRGGACSAGWANQWLLLPPLTMVAGTTYTLSFWYITSGVTWQTLRAQVSNVATVPAVTSTTMGGTPTTIGPGLSSFNNTTYAQYVQTFTVAATGTYYVGLGAESGTGAGLMAIDDIEVCAVPTVTATHSTAPYCIPATVTLSSTGTSGAVTYAWAGPSGYTSTLAMPAPLTGLGAGTYTYTLTAVNDPVSAGFGGICTSSATATFTMNNPPSAITGGTAICTGQTTTLSNTTTGGTWSSSATAVGTVDAAGVVTGISAGTTTITYSVGGCIATIVVTVTTMPTPITGIMVACLGSTTTLTSTPTGGTWSSSNTNATIASPSTGVVTGAALGTAIITYSFGSGCYVTTLVSVNPTPNPITGSFSICVGTTTPLSSTTTGGIWTSSSPAVASIGALSGIALGNTLGTANISYTFAGCRSTQVVTVVAAPSPIVGPTSVCLFSPTITLTTISVGGTWTSSNANVSIGSSSGVVTGLVAGGTSTISYSLSAGCIATTTITVLPATAPVTGTLTVCPTGTTTLGHPIPGGTWVSGSANATVGLITGIVTGATPGTAGITYTLPSGCVSVAIVTVNAAPAAITGVLTVCVGNTTTLSSATPGVVWSSSAPGIASVGAGTGIVTGGAVGTATITAATTAGCQVTAVVTVDPAPGAILGTPVVCEGQTITLSSAVPGGAWSSSVPAVGTVSGAGVVTGILAGTTTITYVLPSGCYTTVVVTVNAAPAPITGSAVLCVGFTTTLASTTPGGVWTSGNPTVASILAPGLIGGGSVGTANISYTISGCSAIRTVTVNALPGTITGALNVCVSGTTTLSATPAGGTWASGSANATIDLVTGVVTGVNPGTASITYALGSGCNTSTTVTVNALPSAIGGTLNICAGVTSTLTSSPTGGTWASSDLSVVTIGVGTGSATGVPPGGTATITYALSTGCTRSAVMTVSPLPAVITGVTNVCIGATTTLNSTTAGGTWASSNGNATVNPITGVVTGAFAGTSTITYTLPTGCYRTVLVQVNPLPTAIGGSLQVCEGSATTLTGTPAGGTWSSACPTIGTITTGSGIFTGIAPGTCIITYTLISGCAMTSTITVNPLPGAVTGVPNVCIGQTTTLNSTPAGGTWSTSSPNASVNATTGVVTGNIAGTASISYTLVTGCRRAITVTVYALPGVITGSLNVCQGGTTTLNCVPAGGTWTSSATGYATVGVTTGIVTGVSATPPPATATITYTLGTGCTRTTTVTVNPPPDPIGGSLTTCVLGSTNLVGSPAGGTWQSGNTSVATVSGSGVVTGVAGTFTATISYTLPTTCRITAEVTVYGLPANIAGSLQVCEGATTTLTTTTPGGTWASSNPAVGTIDVATGIVAGILQGTTTITYTLGTGCFKTAVVTVNPIPAPIGGGLQVCQFGTTTLSNFTSGGVWSSGTTSVATISAGGVVTGILPGTSIISYTMGTSCRSTATVTVNSLPSTIVGPSEVCVNSSISLSSTPPGGTWSSPHGTVSVNTITGAVTGVSAGTATISYTVGTGCVRTTTVLVNPLPDPIMGNPGVCIGFTTLLTTTSTGGAWSSTVPGVATIDAGGLVTSVAVGNTTISYTLPVTGCATTVDVTVNPLPAPITGSDGFCNLSSTLYSSATPGGTWSTANPAVLTILPSGMATGVSVDTTDVIYTLPTTCSVKKRVFLILAPYPITGPDDVCLGQCVTVSNVIGGGGWTSSNSVAAPITSAGLVCGNALGTTNITYVLSTGCFTTHTMTVNPIPDGIIGSLQICQGETTTLTNLTPGGTWLSGNTAVAQIGSLTGIATGVSGGTAMITYALGTGCNAIVVVTVNPLPGAIAGAYQVCEGLSTTLTSSSAGGIWSSQDPAVAFIDASTGIMTGMSAMTPGILGVGMTIITYTLPATGCKVMQNVTVNPLPSPISGAVNVCVGDCTVLSNATPGGGWISSNPAVGTIDGVTGVFCGVSGGSVVVSYILPTGCIATWNITVHDNPSPIAGALSVCAGFSTNLISTPPGGVWSQDPTSMVYGTIHSITGVVSGITAGVIPVTYTMGSGCRAVNEVTVITLPAVIGGPPKVCVNDSVDLTNPVFGGVWTSSNPARATVDPGTGRVHGVSAGPVVITYTVGTGCFNILNMTVNPLPLPITGPLQVCEGATIVLSSGPTPGGNWISDATPIATVGFMSGIVSGLTAGVANISYALAPSGCLRAVQVTVNPTPPAILGNPHVCIGATAIFTNTMAGGSWHSSNPAVATIGLSTGIVTSATTGTTIISYVMPGTLCMATRVITVQPLPNVYNVTGGGSYCSGGNGVSIGLDGSQPGVSYVLYHGSSVTGYLPGTGFALDFDLHTAGGVYTVQATNVTSSCVRNMAGSATVTVIPLVTPSVTTILTPYDSVCPGQSVTLAPVPVNGGTAPTYLWKVNGVNVSTGVSYGFVPANGDIVTVVMTSNANCTATPSATANRTITVLPNAMPIAGVVTTPNDTLCQFNPVTFTAAPVYGGVSPLFTWLVNGVAAGTGAIYSYIPVDGDVVKMTMVSDYRCRLATTVTSGDVNMSVDSMLIPTVSVSPAPGFMVESGKPVTLYTAVTNGGANPRYQWKVNGHAISGATLSTYTAVFNDYDSISCEVISGGVCNNIGTSDWVFITVAPAGTQLGSGIASDIRLIPNPNKGVFTIKGSLGQLADGAINIDVTDMLGQVVYRGVINVKQGRLDAQVSLDNTLANGMYILTLRSEQEQKVFHFVMEQ